MSSRLLSSLGRRVEKIGKRFLGRENIFNDHGKRNLNVHEHVAHGLLREAGIPTPPFGVAKSPQEAEKIAHDLRSRDLVLKAQVLAGGRAKGRFKNDNISGVVLCETPEEASKNARKMLGNFLVTKQTGDNGKICNEGPVAIVSTEGGVNIEETAVNNPDAITYFPIDIRTGMTIDEAKKIVEKLNLDECNEAAIAEVVYKLYKLFIAKDALLLEINPFVEDICGDYYALDCKCNFDDSAEFRQTELFGLRDWSQNNPSEVIADKHGLNYIALDGNIGCMVNGAGLAMATMDIIKLYGGEPANFLDVGGSATTETVMEAFKILSSDPKVDAILVNIFGGIMRCDIIAEGIIQASKSLNLKIPVITRLQGTKVDEARALIAKADLKIISIDDMSEAADASVKIAKMINIAKSLNLELNLKHRNDETSSMSNENIENNCQR